MIKSIRDLIKDYQAEILQGNLLPERASIIMVELSAVVGNCNDEIRMRDIEYSLILLECYNKETKANRAKIKAETTKEYEAKRIARDTKDLVIEMIRSLKYYLRACVEEYRVSSNL